MSAPYRYMGWVLPAFFIVSSAAPPPPPPPLVPGRTKPFMFGASEGVNGAAEWLIAGSTAAARIARAIALWHLIQSLV